MRGKAVAKGVATGGFGNPGGAYGGAHGFLQPTLIEMMPAHDLRPWVRGRAISRKDILPGPLALSVGILALQSIWHIHHPTAARQVLLVRPPHDPEMILKRCNEMPSA